MSSMNLKNLIRILHLNRMLFRFALHERRLLKLQMQLCSEFAHGWPTSLFTWLVFKAQFSEECTRRRNQASPSAVPPQSSFESFSWECHLSICHWGSVESLEFTGVFSPGLAQCSFLWAALSGRSEIEDSLLSAVVFFWQLWALFFCWQVVLGLNMLWFFQAVFWICVPVVKKSRNCPFIWKPTERPIPLMSTFGNTAKSPLVLVCYTAKFMVHGCEHQGTCQNVGCLHLHQSSPSRAVVTEGAFFVPH